MKTSVDSGHDHTIPKGQQKGRTSKDMGHDHFFSLKNRMTGPGGSDGHRHRILK